MSSYDREYVDRVLAELEGDLSFARARWCVCRVLGQLATTGVPGRSLAPARRELWGLARCIDGGLLAHLHGSTKRMVSWKDAARAVTPFGWRSECVWDRDCIAVMPAWVYYPRRWWRRARWWWYWRGR